MVSPSGLAFGFSLVYNEPHIIKSKSGSEGCSAPHQHQHGWSPDTAQETLTNIDQVMRSSRSHEKCMATLVLWARAYAPVSCI